MRTRVAGTAVIATGHASRSGSLFTKFDASESSAFTCLHTKSLSLDLRKTKRVRCVSNETSLLVGGLTRR